MRSIDLYKSSLVPLLSLPFEKSIDEFEKSIDDNIKYQLTKYINDKTSHIIWIPTRFSVWTNVLRKVLMIKLVI